MEDQKSNLDCLEPSSDIMKDSESTGIRKGIGKAILPILGAALVTTAAGKAQTETTTLPNHNSLSITCDGTLTRSGDDYTCRLYSAEQPVEGAVSKVRRGKCDDKNPKKSIVNPIGSTTVSHSCKTPLTDSEGNINDVYSYEKDTITCEAKGPEAVSCKVFITTDNGILTYTILRPEKPRSNRENDGRYQLKSDQPMAPQNSTPAPTPTSDPSQHSYNSTNNPWFNLDFGYQLEKGAFQADLTNGGTVGAGVNLPAGEDSNWFYGARLQYSQLESNVVMHNIDSVVPNVSQNIVRIGAGPSLTYMPDWIGLTLNATGGVSRIHTGETVLRHDQNNNTYIKKEGEQLGPFISLQAGPQVAAGPVLLGVYVGGLCTLNANKIPTDRKQNCVGTLNLAIGALTKKGKE